MTEFDEKKAYVAPEVTILGTFEGATLGTSEGINTDAAFPVGTPFSDLTFS